MKNNHRFLTTMLTSAAIVGMLSANAGAVKAVPSTHKLYVNNQLADVAAYNIEGNNYFKLRDIAKLVGFGVSYDPQVNSVALTSNQPYEDDGSGGGTKTAVQATDNAKLSPQTIYVDGAQQSPTVYNINGNNYFKLRDLGEMIDFGVTFTAATSRVDINTEQPYAAEQTTPTTGLAPDDKEDAAAQQPTTPSDKDDTANTESEKPVDTSPVTEADLRAWELEMVDAVNAERRKAGVPELVVSEEAMAYAQYWAESCKTKFKHSTANDVRAYANRIGIEKSVLDGGENIGRIPSSAKKDEVVNLSIQWFMTSPGHKATMLDSIWTHIGIGLTIDENGEIYCVQEFLLN